MNISKFFIFTLFFSISSMHAMKLKRADVIQKITVPRHSYEEDPEEKACRENKPFGERERVKSEQEMDAAAKNMYYYCKLGNPLGIKKLAQAFSTQELRGIWSEARKARHRLEGLGRTQDLLWSLIFNHTPATAIELACELKHIFPEISLYHKILERESLSENNIHTGQGYIIKLLKSAFKKNVDINSTPKESSYLYNPFDYYVVNNVHWLNRHNSILQWFIKNGAHIKNKAKVGANIFHNLANSMKSNKASVSDIVRAAKAICILKLAPLFSTLAMQDGKDDQEVWSNSQELQEIKGALDQKNIEGNTAYQIIAPYDPLKLQDFTIFDGRIWGVDLVNHFKQEKKLKFPSEPGYTIAKNIIKKYANEYSIHNRSLLHEITLCSGHKEVTKKLLKIALKSVNKKPLIGLYINDTPLQSPYLYGAFGHYVIKHARHIDHDDRILQWFIKEGAHIAGRTIVDGYDDNIFHNLTRLIRVPHLNGKIEDVIRIAKAICAFKLAPLYNEVKSKNPEEAQELCKKSQDLQEIQEALDQKNTWGKAAYELLKSDCRLSPKDLNIFKSEEWAKNFSEQFNHCCLPRN